MTKILLLGFLGLVVAVNTCRAQVEIAVFAKSSAKEAHPTAVVEVPVGWSIIGGGATTNWNGSDPGNLLVSSYPLDERHWIASSKDHAVSSPAVLTAYVIAMKNSGAFEVKIFAQRSSIGAHPTVSVSVPLGYTMTGGGAKAETEGPGQLLNASYPQNDTTWLAASTDHIDSSPGTVTAFAIGVKPRGNTPFPAVRRFESVSSQAAHPQVSLTVDTGFLVTGGGAGVEGAPEKGNLLLESIPVGNYGWSARSKDHSYSDPSRIIAAALAIPAKGVKVSRQR